MNCVNIRMHGATIETKIMQSKYCDPKLAEDNIILMKKTEKIVRHSHRPKRRLYNGNCPSDLASARRNLFPERDDEGNIFLSWSRQ